MDRDGTLGGVVTDKPKQKDLKPEERNHVIEPGDKTYESGIVGRANANIAALELLRTLEKENRNATPEEKKVLAKFSGWGALKDILRPDFHAYTVKAKGDASLLTDQQKSVAGIPSWVGQEVWAEYKKWVEKWGKKLHPSLGGLLTREEWTAATESTKNAHYTEVGVVRGMWDLISSLGFKGGVILEPSAGSGNFIGAMPAEIAANSSVAAVELDPMTGRILKKLYPQADVLVKGFEDSGTKPNSVDLVVSNFPFSKTVKPKEAGKPYSGWSVHNFFFGKALDVVKPGGLVVAITSGWTMNGRTASSIRKYFQDKADFVGAIRLPGSAFEESAGTKVVTDIIVLRKKSESAPKVPSIPFLLTSEFKGKDGKSDEPVFVNEYFLSHPEMTIGTPDIGHGLHGMELVVNFKGDVGAEVRERIQYFPRNISGPDAEVDAGSIFRAPELLGTVDGEIIRTADGKLVQSIGGVVEPLDIPTRAKIRDKFRSKADLEGDVEGYLRIRETWRKLTNLQRTQESDEGMDALRKQLSQDYDWLRKRVGPLLWLTENHPMTECSLFPLLTSLERPMKKVINDAGQIVTPEPVKEDIFTRRTDRPFSPPTTAASVPDGYLISMSMLGRIDPAYISKLLGNKTPKQVEDELTKEGLAFRDPETGEMVDAPDYLSGAVVKKLRVAKAAGADENVKALEAVVPKPKKKSEITAIPGVRWVSRSAYEVFMSEVLGINGAKVTREERARAEAWVLEGYGGNQSFGGSDAKSFFQHVMNGQRIEVRDRDNHVLPEETEQANIIADAMKEAFSSWFQNSPETDNAVAKFNETVHGIVPRKSYVPPPLVPALEAAKKKRKNETLTKAEEEAIARVRFPGQSEGITLDPHQIKAVYRAVRENTMLAHFAGAGKTYEFIATAMEMKRLGLAKKPLVVAHNATIAQYAASVLKLYPGAKVLVPSKSDRSAANRRRFLGKVNATDWDMIVIPQSFFNMIGVSDDAFERMTEQNIQKLEEEQGRYPESSRNAKKIGEKITALRQEMKERREGAGKEVLSFEDLGTDALLIDEAHAYKRSQFETTKTTTKGLDLSSSNRSANLMMILQIIRNMQGGRNRNVVLATGTPISNTMTEAWTYLRYLRPDLLKVTGTESFDEFSDTFMQQVTDFEMTDSGEFKAITRFASYANVSDLNALIRSVFDVVGENDVERQRMVKMRGGEPRLIEVKRSKMVEDLFAWLQYKRWEWDRLPGIEKMENSSFPLEVQTIMRKASIDLRLVDSSAPFDPDGKLAKAAVAVRKNYQASASRKGTQIIFCDLRRSADKKFQLWDEMKRLLVAEGIPENEIASIYDHDTDDKREKLFDKVRTGEVRVLMGATEKIGVGVDVAERMVAAIHLDVPVRPMDFEQRNKRVIRQTNLNDEADVIVMGTEKSLDAVNFGRLKIKQGFIDQGLRGEMVEGEDVNEGETVMTFAELAGVLSGDTRVADLSRLQKELSKVVAGNALLRRALERNESEIKYGEQAIAGYKEAVEGFKKSKEIVDRQLSVLEKLEDVIETADKIVVGGDYFSRGNMGGAKEAIDRWRESWLLWADDPKANRAPDFFKITFPDVSVFINTDRKEGTTFTADFQSSPSVKGKLPSGRTIQNILSSVVPDTTNEELRSNERMIPFHQIRTDAAKRDIETMRKPDAEKEEAVRMKVADLTTQIGAATSREGKAVPPRPEWVRRGVFSSERMQYHDTAVGTNPANRGTLNTVERVMAKAAAKGLGWLAELAWKLLKAGASFAVYIARVGTRAARDVAGGLWREMSAALKNRPPGDRTGGIGRGFARKAVTTEPVKTRIEKATTPEGQRSVAFEEGVKTERPIARQAVKYVEMTAEEARREIVRTGKVSARARAALVRHARRLPVGERGKVLGEVATATPETAPAVARKIETLSIEAKYQRAWNTMKRALRSIRKTKLRPEYASAAAGILEMMPEQGASAHAIARRMRAFLKGDDIVVPDALVTAIERIADQESRRREADQVRILALALRAIAKQSANANKLIFGNMVRDAKAAGAEINAAIEKQPKIEAEPGKDPEAGLLRWFWDEASLNLESIAEMMGDMGKKIFYGDLREGVRRGLDLWHGGQDVLNAAMNKVGLKEKTDEFSNWAAKQVEIPTEGGPLKVSREVKMNLAATILDKANRAELLKGGIKLADEKQTGPRYRFSEGDLDSIVNSLDEKERALVEAMRGYLNTTLKKAVNEAAVTLWGFEKAVKGDYWPRTRKLEETGMNAEQRKWNSRASLEGIKILKERTTSKAPLVIGGIFQTYNQHLKHASTFSGLAVPIRNANVVMKSGKVEETLIRQHGKQRVRRIEQHLDALQDMGTPGGGEANKAVAGWVRNIQASFLGLSLRSMLKQFGGLFTLAGEADIKDVLAGMKNMSLREDDETKKKIYRYSPLLRERYDSAAAALTMPTFDTAEGITAKAQAKLTKFQEFALSGLTKFDRLITQAAWGTAESEIKRESPGKTGDEFYEAVARRAEELVSRSQNVTSVIDMSGLALESRQNAFAKVMIAFQSQGNAMFNMLRRGVMLYNQGKLDKAGLAKRIAMVAIGNALWVSLVGSMFQAGGGDDPEKRRKGKGKKPRIGFWQDKLLDMAQENSGMVYGMSLFAPSAMRNVRAAIEDRSTYGTPLKLENVAESVSRNLLEGVGGILKAVDEAGEKFASGPKKGESKSRAALERASGNFARGVAGVVGIPQFSGVRDVWTLLKQAGIIGEKKE